MLKFRTSVYGNILVGMEKIKAQSNYCTIKKEILSIILCVDKFQTDLLNKKFLICIDCKSAKHVLEKDVQNIASKQVFARWQSIYIYIYIFILR
jgi:hypothetical protein